ncbi:MAG: DUF1330 domain-containing protein [Pseudomonadota bacterium]
MTAYVIALVDVQDPEHYKNYTAKTPDLVAQYGGQFVVRGGDTEVLEGSLLGQRVVVISFPDRAAAKTFYESEAYQAILPIRKAASTGSFFIVDGVD